VRIDWPLVEKYKDDPIARIMLAIRDGTWKPMK